ncbi:MAG TPA: mechanosensitive ion channel protein MscS, partial [Halomonas sp.]|nr:mechanosensitive ion channel protein MscS [Halomonas sp.]
MRQHWITQIIVGVVLSMLLSAAALAQSASLPNLTGGDSSEQSEVSNEDFQRSLGNVISMLENEEQRTALLDSLRELQVSTEAAEEDGV